MKSNFFKIAVLSFFFCSFLNSMNLQTDIVCFQFASKSNSSVQEDLPMLKIEKLGEMRKSNYLLDSFHGYGTDDFSPNFIFKATSDNGVSYVSREFLGLLRQINHLKSDVKFVMFLDSNQAITGVLSRPLLRQALIGKDHRTGYLASGMKFNSEMIGLVVSLSQLKEDNFRQAMKEIDTQQGLIFPFLTQPLCSSRDREILGLLGKKIEEAQKPEGMKQSAEKEIQAIQEVLVRAATLKKNVILDNNTNPSKYSLQTCFVLLSGGFFAGLLGALMYRCIMH